MKPPYNKPPAPPSPPHKHYYKPTLMPPITPPPCLNVDEWIAKQEAEQADLQKMYNYIAALAKHRYESFLAAGFTELQSFELTKIYITL